MTFMARGETLAALTDHGLRIDSPLGDVQLENIQATDDPRQIGVVDLVVVALKAWQVSAVAPTLAPLISDETAVLPLQNGVEAAAQLAAALGPRPVLDGLCKIISLVEKPGHIRHVGAEPFIELGERDDTRSQRVERIAEVLSQAGITVEISPDVRSAVWQKFLFIAAVSGLGAITRSSIGVIRETPETRQMLIEAMDEIVAVGRGHGIALPDDAVARTLQFIAALPFAGTASMQRDLMAGRPSELEAQNGAVVHLGQQAGIATPINRFIYHSLLPMERQARADAAQS